MTSFLLTLAVMIVLTTIRTLDSSGRVRGPLLFLFGQLCGAFKEDQEFRAIANLNFNTTGVK
jgi:hypothetical protein